MHSSISSFERTIPAQSWPGLLLVVSLLTAGAAVAWEMHCRALGYAPSFAPDAATGWTDGDAYVVAVQGGRPPHGITGVPGSLVTLIAAGGDASGITTSGLQYPLQSGTLRPGTTRGVSNVLVGERGSVALDRGTLLVMQPFGGAL